MVTLKRILLRDVEPAEAGSAASTAGARVVPDGSVTQQLNDISPPLFVHYHRNPHRPARPEGVPGSSLRVNEYNLYTEVPDQCNARAVRSAKLMYREEKKKKKKREL